MKRNIGTIDSSIRLVVGLLLLYIGFFPNPIVAGGFSKTLIGLCSLIPLVTGLTRYCPLYVLIGADTLGRDEKSRT